MQKLQTTILLLAGFFAAFLLFQGCGENNTINNPEGQESAEAVLKSMIEESDEINSFEYNYNEDDGGDGSLLKVADDIVPLHVKQRMRLLSKTIDIEFQGDTAYCLVTAQFQGELYIAASLDSALVGDISDVDTIIVKGFSTTSTRKVIFVNMWEEEGRNPDNNPKDADGKYLYGWRILAFSLPEAGTAGSNVLITKMTVHLSSGDSLVVTDPNEFFLYRPEGLRHQIPNLTQGDSVIIRVELQSAYPDTDYVSLTYGAVRGKLFRSKKLFELVSSELNGQAYNKVYQNIWHANQYRGPKHAIINVIPRTSIHDSSAAVEEHTWGLPYLVK